MVCCPPVVHVSACMYVYIGDELVSLFCDKNLQLCLDWHSPSAFSFPNSVADSHFDRELFLLHNHTIHLIHENVCMYCICRCVYIYNTCEYTYICFDCLQVKRLIGLRSWLRSATLWRRSCRRSSPSFVHSRTAYQVHLISPHARNRSLTVFFFVLIESVEKFVHVTKRLCGIPSFFNLPLCKRINELYGDPDSGACPTYILCIQSY